MNIGRKILASALLASVMSLSLSYGAVAAEAGEPDLSFTEAADSALVLEAEDGSVTRLQKDADGLVTLQIDGVDTRLTEAEFLELKETFNEKVYIGGTEDVKTSGGDNGSVMIRSGVYTFTINPIGNVIQKYYGVTAEIVDSSEDGSNLRTNITIEATFSDRNDRYKYSRSEDTGYLQLERYPSIPFIHCDATITTTSPGFGDSSQIINVNF